MSKKVQRLITEIIDIDSQYQGGYDMMISYAAGFQNDIELDRLFRACKPEFTPHLWPRCALVLTAFICLTALFT